MPSSAYLSSIRTALEDLVAPITLKELTNQRAGETSASGAAATHPAINDDMIDKCILLAANEIEEYLAPSGADDYTYIKFSAELALSDMASKWSLNMTDIGVQDKMSIIKAAKDVGKVRVLSKKRTRKGDRKTGWKKPASGFDPFDEIS